MTDEKNTWKQTLEDSHLFDAINAFEPSGEPCRTCQIPGIAKDIVVAIHDLCEIDSLMQDILKEAREWRLRLLDPTILNGVFLESEQFNGYLTYLFTSKPVDYEAYHAERILHLAKWDARGTATGERAKYADWMCEQCQNRRCRADSPETKQHIVDTLSGALAKIQKLVTEYKRCYLLALTVYENNYLKNRKAAI